ncbi:hypothetical protein [Agromyces lapidis]|uniref:Uncharacterized protein n=1 Tax=Agromyces lapidis TaxID=279574 RepID=A0ABV5SPT7_9MICO|nr:hypothetical protein [Agromyces lapidis]
MTEIGDAAQKRLDEIREDNDGQWGPAFQDEPSAFVDGFEAGALWMADALADWIRGDANRSAIAQRAHDDAEGIEPVGTSTPNEVEWYQAGNWAHSRLRARARELGGIIPQPTPEPDTTEEDDCG